MTNEYYKSIYYNVQVIRENIAKAAAKAGRDEKEITLVGVTKTQSYEKVRSLLQAGVTTIGENRVQELLEKEEFLTDIPHETHLIGHLQRNKAKYLPGHVGMVQSVDSEKTALALDKAFEAAQTPLDILIEVNIGQEESKNGVLKQDLSQVVESVRKCNNLRLRGLMAIPPFGLGEGIRVYFEQMFQLFIDIKAEKMDNENVNILSMGMSDDYEYAILEGATMVRVGTKLFGPRIY